MTGIDECEVTDGFFNPEDPECNKCEFTCRELCKLFAIRRDLKTEEDLQNKRSVKEITARFFKGD